MTQTNMKKNINKSIKITSLPNGKIRLTMKDGSEHTMGRREAENLAHCLFASTGKLVDRLIDVKKEISKSAFYDPCVDPPRDGFDKEFG